MEIVLTLESAIDNTETVASAPPPAPAGVSSTQHSRQASDIGPLPGGVSHVGDPCYAISVSPLAGEESAQDTVTRSVAGTQATLEEAKATPRRMFPHKRQHSRGHSVTKVELPTALKLINDPLPAAEANETTDSSRQQVAVEPLGRKGLEKVTVTPPTLPASTFLADSIQPLSNGNRPKYSTSVDVVSDLSSTPSLPKAHHPRAAFSAKDVMSRKSAPPISLMKVFEPPPSLQHLSRGTSLEGSTQRPPVPHLMLFQEPMNSPQQGKPLEEGLKEGKEQEEDKVEMSLEGGGEVKETEDRSEDVEERKDEKQVQEAQFDGEGNHSEREDRDENESVEIIDHRQQGIDQHPEQLHLREDGQLQQEEPDEEEDEQDGQHVLQQQEEEEVETQQQQRQEDGDEEEVEQEDEWQQEEKGQQQQEQHEVEEEEGEKKKKEEEVKENEKEGEEEEVEEQRQPVQDQPLQEQSSEQEPFMTCDHLHLSPIVGLQESRLRTSSSPLPIHPASSQPDLLSCAHATESIWLERTPSHPELAVSLPLCSAVVSTGGPMVKAHSVSQLQSEVAEEKVAKRHSDVTHSYSPVVQLLAQREMQRSQKQRGSMELLREKENSTAPPTTHLPLSKQNSPLKLPEREMVRRRISADPERAVASYSSSRVKGRPMSMFETSSYHYQSVEVTSADFLTQLFWTSACLLESDYEGEFSLALRMLEKVLARMDLYADSTYSRLEGLLHKMQWENFPGVQQLILKGLTLDSTTDPTRQLLATLSPHSTRAVFDPSQYSGLPVNIVSLLPELILHFDEPTQACRTAATSIASVSPPYTRFI